MSGLGTRRRGEEGTGRKSPRHRVSLSPCLPVTFIAFVAALALAINFASFAQTRRSGAHSTVPRENFTLADRTLVERAVRAGAAELGVACRARRQ